MKIVSRRHDIGRCLSTKASMRVVSSWRFSKCVGRAMHKPKEKNKNILRLYDTLMDEVYAL